MMCDRVFLFVLCSMLYCRAARTASAGCQETQADSTEARMFTQKLFQKYGGGKSITFEALEHLFVHLEVGDIVIDSHGLSDHLRKDGGFRKLHGKEHAHPIADNSSSAKVEISHHGEGPPTGGRFPGHGAYNVQEEADTSERSCWHPRRLMAKINKTTSDNVSMVDFINICPALVFQIDSDECRQPNGLPRHLNQHKSSARTKSNVTAVTNSFTKSSTLVWGSGMLAVFIISVVGLAGVAVVPVIQKKFYNEVLHFLVAVAIGALTGDAMLHLLPHALAEPHVEETGDEAAKHSGETVWKGLVGLSGVFVFFIAERTMNIINTARNNKKERCRLQMKIQKVEEESCLKQTAEDLELNVNGGKTKRGDNRKDVIDLKSEDDNEIADEKEHGDPRSHIHGHSHEHSYGHGAPSSASAVAAMVILGDGLHNFSDGLAIGAAFASGLSVGVSTTLAVFCHELPHELGDFAMLLKTGMSVRLAILYNLVSSILCFLGAAIGILVAKTEDASHWILLVTAGIFVYIALVDMLPEMAIPKNSSIKKQITSLLLQMCGILIGSGVMLIIAVYEDKITID